MLKQETLRENFQSELRLPLKIGEEVEEAWLSFYLKSNISLSFYTCYDCPNKKCLIYQYFFLELVFTIRYIKQSIFYGGFGRYTEIFGVIQI